MNNFIRFISKMEEIQSAFFYSEFPFVIKNKIDRWRVLSYKEDDWCKEFENKVLRFRQGFKSYKERPYWESQCRAKEMTIGEFFDLSKQKQESWLYFDYHYMKDIFKEDNKLLNEIKWEDLNLLNLSGRDSTFWIGNEGAHTPCHMDSYGCNFIAQILGRKLWILIPPEETEHLRPTRVPYEESSIYSSYNFYTPTNKLLNLKKCYSVVLTPGDVLFVPRHWWHYVENLETSISINVWVPLELDDESRLDEALVRYYISNICNDLTDEECQSLLNPNEISLLSELCTFDLVHKCAQNYEKLKIKNQENKYDVKSLFENCVFPVEEFNMGFYVKQRSEIFNYDLNIPSQPQNDKINGRLLLAKDLINSYCHPRNVAKVRESLFHYGRQLSY